MKKVQTVYVSKDHKFNIAVNEEFKDHLSVYSGFEPCSGLVRHWGRKDEIIKELEGIVEVLKKFKV